MGRSRAHPPAGSEVCADTEAPTSDTELSERVAELKFVDRHGRDGKNPMTEPKGNKGPESLSDFLIVKQSRHQARTGTHESVLLNPNPSTKNSVSSEKTTTTVF